MHLSSLGFVLLENVDQTTPKKINTGDFIFQDGLEKEFKHFSKLKFRCSLTVEVGLVPLYYYT